MTLPNWIRNPWIQTALIGTACIGVYAGIRSVPVEACSFLHYGDYVNDEGVIEGCGFEETTFFDLTELRYPVIATLQPLTPPRTGTPVMVELQLSTSTGRPIRYEDVAVSHTERLHCMVVDASRDDYRHLHPQPAGPPGSYVFEFTPQRSGEYTIFLDFISLLSGKRTLTSASLMVDAADAAPHRVSSRPPNTERLEAQTANHTFRLVPPEGGFAPEKESRFRLEVKALDSSPVVFEPVMDSYAHVVAFDDRRRGFAHFHPDNAIIATEPREAPDLEFVFRLDHPGHYRIWAQVQIDGQEIFVPFDIHLADAKANA